VVYTFAAYQDHHSIVFGNVIGSNIFNLFVILGFAGLITPIVVQSSTVWKEIPLSLAGIILLYLMANGFFMNENTLISRADGLVLLSLFILFLLYVYHQLRRDIAEAETKRKSFSDLKIWSFIILGLTGLVLGGRFVVNNAVLLATSLGMSEKLTGLTIVAAGTSLPELATSMVAAIKKNNDIAVGNLIGSNIFNIFLILGVSSLIRPLNYDKTFNADLGILTVGTIILLLAMLTGTRKKLDRWEAGILTLGYVGYILFMIHK
jgi:cation:H+ antiporter